MPLRDKLAALTAPCREVDAEIADVFGAPNAHFTASLDATVELVERELPEWNMTVWKFNAGPERGRTHVSLSRIPIFKGYSETAHSLPAVAMLLALVNAKGIE